MHKLLYNYYIVHQQAFDNALAGLFKQNGPSVKYITNSYEKVLTETTIHLKFVIRGPLTVLLKWSIRKPYYDNIVQIVLRNKGMDFFQKPYYREISTMRGRPVLFPTPKHYICMSSVYSMHILGATIV